MRSPPGKQPSSEQQWLIDACTAEIRVHRIIFLLVLNPLLGVWLPHLLFYLGLSVLITVQANVAGDNSADRSS
jgi:hypothetical protein